MRLLSCWITIWILLINLVTPGGNAYFQSEIANSAVSQHVSTQSQPNHERHGHEHHASHQSETHSANPNTTDSGEHSNHHGSGSHLGSSHCPLCVFEEDGLQVETHRFLSFQLTANFADKPFSLIAAEAIKTPFYKTPQLRAPPKSIC